MFSLQLHTAWEKPFLEMAPIILKWRSKDYLILKILLEMVQEIYIYVLLLDTLLISFSNYYLHY